MAGKKFPYMTAYVACGGFCRTNTKSVAGERCEFGCLGCGECEKKCKFDAIHIENGVAKVDPEKCKACTMCIKVCPRGIIRLREIGMPIQVRCSNHDIGKKAMAGCGNSCIACGICTKKCPAESIKLIDNLPVIDPQRCLSCGTCVVNCPRGAVVDLRGIL